MRHKRFTLLNPKRSVRSNLIGLKLIAVLLLGLGLSGLQAQESVNATGGNASGSGGSASYSIGQVMYQTHSKTNGSVTEGVQQPYEISVVTGINEAKGINLSVTAYPNPATDFLTLEVNDFELSPEGFRDLHFQLYDMSGKLLQNQKITGSHTSISMSNLVPASYFIKVVVKTQGIASQQEIKNYKIIKK